METTTICTADTAPPHTLPLRSPVRTRKVCHVSMTLQTGGLERLLVDFGRFRNAEQVDPMFVSLAGLGLPAIDLRERGFHVESLDIGKQGKVNAIRRLSQLYREHGVDLVHTHNTYPHFYGAIAAKLSGIPAVINTQHGRGAGDNWKAHMQFRMANCWTARIVGVSEDAARICRRQDPRAAQRIIHLWNGIDLSRFTWHGPADKPVAISVARLSQIKDFPTLLRGVAKVITQVPDFRLRIVGDGPERLRLERLTDELSLRGHVEFLGERNDVPELLRDAGFFVSSTKSEGVSLTLLEAMAVGLPVLTTSVGGNPEVVADGETGRLVEPLNPDAIAAGMLEMLRDRDEWPLLGRNGRERVEEHFNVRKMVSSYEALYAEVLGDSHPRTESTP
ncbi:MAG: glycosyltransferase [Planctomycetaceae bacterium]